MVRGFTLDAKDKVSKEVLDKIGENGEIEVVLSLEEINDDILSELEKLGEVKMVVRLTRHILMRIPKKSIMILAEKPYIKRIDVPKTMRVLNTKNTPRSNI